MKKLFFVALAVLLTSCSIFGIQEKQTNQEIKDLSGTLPVKDSSELILENLKPNQLLESPFVLKGKAKGSWFFEAVFPVRLIDEKGKELVATNAEAKGEWMTEDFVQFEVKMNFEKPENKSGTLVLIKNNPSGLPENSGEEHIPVKFK